MFLDSTFYQYRYQNQVKDCRSYSSLDIDSDHNMMIVECTHEMNKFEKMLICMMVPQPSVISQTL